MLASIATGVARPMACRLLRRRIGPLPVTARALSSPGPSSSSSSSPSSRDKPAPPPHHHEEEDAEKGGDASHQLQQTAKELHPALVSLLNSGFIESRRRLREELAEDAWRGEPVGDDAKGSDDGVSDGNGGGDGLARPPQPPPLAHTSPPSWAARRGIARFERFLAGGGDAGEPPPFPATTEEAAVLERAIAGMYAAVLDEEAPRPRPRPPPPPRPPLPPPPVHLHRRRTLEPSEGQHEHDPTREALRALEPSQEEPEERDPTREALRALERARAALPTPRHRLLARAFVEASLAEALREGYERAAKESREMANLWGGGGGGGGGSGAAAAAGGIVWRGIKRLLPWGWVAWPVPGGGGGKKG